MTGLLLVTFVLLLWRLLGRAIAVWSDRFLVCGLCLIARNLRHGDEDSGFRGLA
jgi:hypothetical protein